MWFSPCFNLSVYTCCLLEQFSTTLIRYFVFLFLILFFRLRALLFFLIVFGLFWKCTVSRFRTKFSRIKLYYFKVFLFLCYLHSQDLHFLFDTVILGVFHGDLFGQCGDANLKFLLSLNLGFLHFFYSLHHVVYNQRIGLTFR